MLRLAVAAGALFALLVGVSPVAAATASLSIRVMSTSSCCWFAIPDDQARTLEPGETTIRSQCSNLPGC
jgi:hypothetical protein